jgi:L,D-transpeptidase ErfK/SrfK
MAYRDFSRREVFAGLGAAGAVLLTQPRLAVAAAGYPTVIGKVATIEAQKGDTLMDIMRRHNLGYDEIVAANPKVDPWLPGEGTEIVLPTQHVLPEGPREGLLLNLPEQRLYYFQGSGEVRTFAIGIGADGKTTPLGRTAVVRKQKDPVWYVPKSILKEEPDHKKIVPAGPENPLGKHALYLNWPGYLIHGTNLPDAIGRRASHGCINMYPEGVSYLFDHVGIGTSVTVVSQQAKAALIDGAVFLQVHLNGDQADQIEATGKFDPAPVPDLAQRIDRVAGPLSSQIDWDIVLAAVARRDGIPVRISKEART